MMGTSAVAKRHYLRNLLLGAGVATVLLYPVTSRAADQDGLQRFQKLLPAIQAELKKDGGGTFSFAKSSAIGASGFELDDVTINVPADPSQPDSKPTKASIKKLVVEDLDFDRIDPAHLDSPKTGPYFIKMALQGLTIDGGMQDQMKALGLPPASVDFGLDYRYDETHKTLSLNKLEILLPSLASLNLTMILDGVPPPGADAAQQAQDNATLRTATLTYDDHSLLSRVLPLAATMGGMPIDQGITMLRTTLGAMLAGQSPASVANGDALVSFAMDWQAPKGPLEVRLTPAPKTSFAMLKQIDTPDAAQKLLGLAITYTGTKAGVAMASAPATGPAPSAAAPSPAPSAPAAAAPSGGTATASLCTKDARVFLLDKDDGTLSAATVIEGTSGGRCIVRLDGAAKGDDTVASAADLRHWSIDGPGTAISACDKGKAVYALSDGTWTPGKIAGAGKGGKCEVKIEGEDDTSFLAMDSIRVATDD